VVSHLFNNVDPTAKIMTDEWKGYGKLSKAGFAHQTVNHASREWVRGSCHTNGLEGFWSQLKRSVRGTYHFVSRKHLQKYVNEFSFRYNRRKSQTAMFHHVAARVASQHGAAV
jgi:transposase-like protein